MQFVKVAGGLAGNSFALCIETARSLKSTRTVHYHPCADVLYMRHAKIELAEPRRPYEYTLDQLAR